MAFMNSILKTIKHEIIHIIPAFIYFLITFNLIVFTENLMLREHAAGYISYMLATIGALITVKFLIIVNNLRIVNALQNKPLLYNIIWKICVYNIFLLAFRVIEKSMDLYFKLENTALVFPRLHAILTSPTFWAVQIWLLILFVIYIVSVEFINVIGKNKIKSLLFDKRK